MSERKIKPVGDGKEKFLTYTDLLGKYNLAMENDFYFEAMFIAYGMLEDRLSSYLYYLGCLKSRESFKFDNIEVQNLINTLAEKYCTKNERKNLDITGISGKRNVISATLKWAKSGCEECESDYLSALKDVYSKLTVDEVFEHIKKAEEWCEYRNELIHAMMNKNIDSLYEELSDKAVEGIKLARYFDSIVKKIKSKNEIRKSIGLN